MLILVSIFCFGIYAMIHDRIQQRLDDLGLKQADIARATGKSTAAVTKWLRGENVPKIESLQEIAKLLKISQEWLLTGQHPETSNAEMTKHQVRSWVSEEQPPEGMVAIKYLRSVVGALGDGYINFEDDEDAVDRLWFRADTIKKYNVNPETSNIITVRGDSMYPDLVDGQAIAIDRSATRIFDGEIYAFKKNGELKIKYLFRHGDGFKAVSRNDDKTRYPDELYTSTDIENENIEIVGQFWWKSEIRRIRR